MNKLLSYLVLALGLQFTAPKTDQNPFPSLMLKQQLNYQASASYWKVPICVLPGCNPGGTDAPASTTQTSGHSSPSLSGSSFAVLLTTNPTSTQTNALYVMHNMGSCPNCNWMLTDANLYVDTSAGNPNNIELDQFLYLPALGPGNGTDAMFGFQCNLGSHLWQYANQSSPWQNTSQSCTAFTFNAWHHFVLYTFFIPGDTSCTGYPRLYWGYVIFDGVKQVLNNSFCSSQLPTGFGGSASNQQQIDIGSTSGTAKTVVIYSDNENLYAGSF